MKIHDAYKIHATASERQYTYRDIIYSQCMKFAASLFGEQRTREQKLNIYDTVIDTQAGEYSANN